MVSVYQSTPWDITVYFSRSINRLLVICKCIYAWHCTCIDHTPRLNILDVTTIFSSGLCNSCFCSKNEWDTIVNCLYSIIALHSCTCAVHVQSVTADRELVYDTLTWSSSLSLRQFEYFKSWGDWREKDMTQSISNVSKEWWRVWLAVSQEQRLVQIWTGL